MGRKPRTTDRVNVFGAGSSMAHSLVSFVDLKSLTPSASASQPALVSRAVGKIGRFVYL